MVMPTFLGFNGPNPLLRREYARKWHTNCLRTSNRTTNSITVNGMEAAALDRTPPAFLPALVESANIAWLEQGSRLRQSTKPPESTIMRKRLRNLRQLSSRKLGF